ncbi:hypothetical protein BDN71DRAFT_1442270 [Pleurotus eryngii]|uniref:MYND-type domain-containing protein n=1 Tax=Pleurotus eryngii TaxID=5323 RepID=A0A9P6DIE5_PLEER|nr:hypothetical protein BDN71DRAFT_1442270 [Pleurotus eryngii]
MVEFLMSSLGNITTEHACGLSLIRELPEPTRSFAFRTFDRSLASTMDFRQHILHLPTPLTPHSWITIVPITFIGLNPADIPSNPKPDMRPTPDAVKRALLCLEILGKCIEMIPCGQALALMTAAFILHNHDCVFPWVHFVQRYYFGEEPRSSDDSSVVANRKLALFILTSVSTSVAQARERISYTEHPLLVETVIDVWRKIIDLDLEANEPYLGTLCQQIDCILTHLWNRGQPSQAVVDLCGGHAAIVALLLAHLERDVERVTDPSNSVPFYKLQSTFPYIVSFLSNPTFVSEFLAQRTITRIAGVMRRLHRKCASHLSSNEIANLAALSSVVLGIFGSFERLAGLPAVEEILSSGILRAARKDSWRTLKSSSGTDALDSLIGCVMRYIMYPTVIRQAVKLLRSPSSPFPDPDSKGIWRTFDTFVAPYGRVWADSARPARFIHEVCATCQIGPGKKVLRKCKGCHMRSYCSVACQRIGWKSRHHKTECKVLSLSQMQSVMINGCHNLMYMASIEDYVLREDLAGKVATCLSSIASKPTCERDEIPVLLVKLDPGGNVFTAKRWADFPDIFCETWKSRALPNLKGRLKYVTVLSLPMGEREFYLSSTIAMMIHGWPLL